MAENYNTVVVSTMVCDDADGFKALRRPERFDDLKSAHEFIHRRVNEEYADGRGGRAIEETYDLLGSDGELTAYFKGGFILFRVDII